MKNQLNLLNQLQELVLTRDEHHQTGDGSHLDALNGSIDALLAKLDPSFRIHYDRLYKKDHIVMAPMVEDRCAVCGMHLPIAQAQQVRLAKTIQTCSSCGRILFDEVEDAPRNTAAKPVRGEPRKSGISRFSAEELMVPDLEGETREAVIAELVKKMADNRFVSNPDALVRAALERESVLPTAMGDVAFPHVRGVEGGGLTLAFGISKKGIPWEGAGKTRVHFVVFTVIPVAVSAFYLRLLRLLSDAFAKKDACVALNAAASPTALWKALVKVTRYSIR